MSSPWATHLVEQVRGLGQVDGDVGGPRQAVHLLHPLLAPPAVLLQRGAQVIHHGLEDRVVGLLLHPAQRELDLLGVLRADLVPAVRGRQVEVDDVVRRGPVGGSAGERERGAQHSQHCDVALSELQVCVAR